MGSTAAAATTARVRLARRARYARHLGADLVWAAQVNRMWWLLVVVAVVLAAVVLGGATQTVAPYAVYTLF